MTQRARHMANDGWNPPTGDVLPRAQGLELEATVAKVLAWGGSADRYRACVLAGLEHDCSQAKSLCAVAAWRAGALALRRDALGRVEDALAGRGLALSAVASALGLAEAEVEPFAVGQRGSPFAWPRFSAGQAVAAIGGFSGLGGPWLAPPTRVADTSDPCRYLVWTGQQAWDVVADVFGSRVSRSESSDSDASADAGPSAALRSFHDTYLVWAYTV